MHEARAPDLRWHAFGEEATGEARVAVADLTRAGLTVASGSAIGLRTEGGRRTLTLDLGLDDPGFSAELPGFPAGPGTWHQLVAEVSWDGGAARELALRAATADAERREEYTARLDLRDPASHALAERLLRPGSSSAAALPALAARIRTHGVVERAGYSVTERRRGLSIAARLGVALGFEHQRITSERRLVDAVAWIRGGPPQRRFDCIGV